MGQRQVILLVIAVALVSVSLFAYFRQKKGSSTPFTVAGHLRENSQSQTDSAVPIAEIEEALNEVSQQVAWRPSSQGFVGSDACA